MKTRILWALTFILSLNAHSRSISENTCLLLKKLIVTSDLSITAINQSNQAQDAAYDKELYRWFEKNVFPLYSSIVVSIALENDKNLYSKSLSPFVNNIQKQKKRCEDLGWIREYVAVDNPYMCALKSDEKTQLLDKLPYFFVYPNFQNINPNLDADENNEIYESRFKALKSNLIKVYRYCKTK